MRPELFFDLDETLPLFYRVGPVWELVRGLPRFVEHSFALGMAKKISPALRLAYYFRRVYLGRKVAIGAGTVIFPGAYIGEGVIIGRNCRIGQNATLRGPLILFDDCVVGPAGEVVHSIFFPGARAAHKNFIGDSLIGSRANLGAGSETANWKLDGSEIGFWVGEERVQTGLTKFGAVIGDGSSIGGNSVFQPGALLGKNSRVGPLVAVPNRYFPDGTVLKS
ncbi:MAG: DapH/DapD/GlmU-related protein [Patescibacteria group bacterium]